MKQLTHKQHSAFSLVETLVSMACIGIVAGSLVFGLLQMNKFAASERHRSSAKQLCQERIEEVLSARYTPGDGSPEGGIPPILADDSEEDVDIYTPKDSTTAKVEGQRFTTVVPTPGVDASLKSLSVTVRVSYEFGGKTHNFTMSTVRSPD